MANVTTQKSDITYLPFEPVHFSAVIALATRVHGENYIDEQSLEKIYQAGYCNNINASWVAITNQPDATQEHDPEQLIGQHYLVGFRLSLGASNWQADKWCSPHLWGEQPNKVAYFKCNTVDAKMRGLGIGAGLLKRSIECLVKQGATAGVAHIWMQSPNNSAFGYFSACGGKLIRYHPNKWRDLSQKDPYECPICGVMCDCVAAEMIIKFNHV